MRKLVHSMFVSLDGVIDNPSWTAPYWNDEIARFKQSEMSACDALLLGRVTYEGFAAAWPGRTDDSGYADKINHMPKYVATRTLPALTWTNALRLNRRVGDAVAELKQGSGGDILMFGSVDLAHSLLHQRLIDELNLLVYPVILGGGRPLFEACDLPVRFTLIEARPMGSTGVVLQRYALAHQE